VKSSSAQVAMPNLGDWQINSKMPDIHNSACLCTSIHPIKEPPRTAVEAGKQYQQRPIVRRLTKISVRFWREKGTWAQKVPQRL
jgi:hypothetical protein